MYVSGGALPLSLTDYSSPTLITNVPLWFFSFTTGNEESLVAIRLVWDATMLINLLVHTLAHVNTKRNLLFTGLLQFNGLLVPVDDGVNISAIFAAAAAGANACIINPYADVAWSRRCHAC